MNIHLIAIGGAIMHSLAINLKQQGHNISGSEDVIYNPAKTRLNNLGLLPELGWNPNNIHQNLDLVILGMHAKADNPELLKAVELKIPVMSFPEFIAHQSKEKTRIVVAGSHGKTSITAMVMHLLKKLNLNFDYVVGAELLGFDNPVKLTQQASIIVIEGDEYLSSPIDRRSKFLWYQPHIACITGIAWDHINVFPTLDSYHQTFIKFVESMSTDSHLFLSLDLSLDILQPHHKGTSHIANKPTYSYKNQKLWLDYKGTAIELAIIGKHNVANMALAVAMVHQLTKTPKLDLYQIMSDFTGAAKRLQPILQEGKLIGYRDFAHAPSKVRATVEAVKESIGSQKLVAILELNTFSSLTPEFLPQYRDSLNFADECYVFIDPETLKRKGETDISELAIREAFNNPKIKLVSQSSELLNIISKSKKEGDLFLLMSSGALGGLVV